MTSVLLSIAALALIGSGSIIKGIGKLLFFVLLFVPSMWLLLGAINGN